MKSLKAFQYTIMSAAMIAAVFAVVSIAQAPQGQADQSPQRPQTNGAQRTGGGRPRVTEKPTNLQVLPKSMTGEEMEAFMQSWDDNLGMHCGDCHLLKRPPSGVGLVFDYADDSKPKKQIARMMVKMTNELNANYIPQVTKLEDYDEPNLVTCGECHQGHSSPPEFKALPEWRVGRNGTMGSWGGLGQSQTTKSPSQTTETPSQTK